MTSYPAEPWDLHGHAYVGVWLLPRRLAPYPSSPATTPVTFFGRAIVCAAFFVYEEPSPLTYDEIMSTVLVREGWRPRVSITHIWVNSVSSRDGGRELWAIPKDLADFEVVRHSSYTAQGIGSLVVRRVRRLPWRLPLGFRIAQDRAGTLLVSPVAGCIRLGLAAARWSLAVDGPLGFLSGHKPLLTLACRPFHLLFGRRADQSPQKVRSHPRVWGQTLWVQRGPRPAVEISGGLEAYADSPARRSRSDRRSAGGCTMSESPIGPGGDPEARPTDDPEITPSSEPGGGSTVIPVEPGVTNPDADG